MPIRILESPQLHWRGLVLGQITAGVNQCKRAGARGGTLMLSPNRQWERGTSLSTSLRCPDRLHRLPRGS